MKELLAHTLPLVVLAAFAGLSAVQAPSALSQPGKGTLGPGIAVPTTQTLSTGVLGLAGSTQIAVGGQDGLWRVTADQYDNAGLPRPAIVVDNTTGGNWPPPLPNSRWISAAVTKYRNTGPIGGGRRSITYTASFNLLTCSGALTMELRADDLIRRVLLNGNVLFEEQNPFATATSVTTGSHARPPLIITYSSNSNFALTNRLDVVVEDSGQGGGSSGGRGPTGLNVAATMAPLPRADEGPPCPNPGQGRG
jgi:hypothetical protein